MLGIPYDTAVGGWTVSIWIALTQKSQHILSGRKKKKTTHVRKTKILLKFRFYQIYPILFVTQTRVQRVHVHF